MDKTDLETKRDVKTDSFAVIFGGRGKEREVSIRGGLSFIKRASALGYNILPIYIAADGRFLLLQSGISSIDGSGLEKLKTEAYPVRLFGKSGFLASGEVISVKRALIILHGDSGEDGTVQGALETAGIEYIGADTAASAIALDKYVTKCVARELQIPVLDFGAYSQSEGTELIKAKIERDIGYPVFIKPRRLGSSIGASAARNEMELAYALKSAFAESPDIIAERCLEKKRELEAAYYSLGGKAGVSAPAEIELGGRFYSYEEKYSQKSTARLNLRADVPDWVKQKISEYTKRLAKALGIRHYARFDFFLKDGDIYLNEVNTIPGMTDKSMFLGMLEGEGIAFSDLLSLIFGGTP